MRTMLIIMSLMLLIAVPAVTAQETTDSEVAITIDRSACFGECPIYTVTVYEDGTVVYNGERFVEVEGEQTIQIEPERVEELVHIIEEAGYFELDDEYMDMMVTDVPYVMTSVTHDGETKAINHYLGDTSAPLELHAVEYFIDKALDTAQWTGKEPTLFLPFYTPDAPTATIMLEHGACPEADCPVYTLALYGEGTVIFLGFDNVAETGIHIAEVESEAVVALAERMTEQGFFDLQDTYTGDEDEPTVITTTLITAENYKQIVRHVGAEDTPEILSTLEAEIIEAAGAAEWIEESA